ncbi:hypothetical protein DBR43_32295 [Pedobacter sp. KBW06]|uniref:hypothetical protein n=1 Tax=Pedobacter sp. KBW06 TaxID=2153359 RepID=UPI000F59B8AD|nr:hypothetical protein [Pedobacter sp. KBW06]RQO64957.1 hypothetical protein DBR43_32295 [Pedobacter sp. KBW06]
MILNKDGLIERIVRTKIGISELSRLLNVSRTSIYNWFEQEYLSIDVVCRIGHAIGHDFANEFPEDFARAGNKIMSDLMTGNPDQQQHYNTSVQYWMNKYITLLEKHNDLLIQINRPATTDGGIPGSVVSSVKNTGQHFSPFTH